MSAIDFAVKKIRPNAPTNLEHFLSAFAADLLLTQKLAYVASGNGAGQAEYIGLALPGTSSASAAWLIKKLTYDSSNRVTDIQFAGGAATFENIWDNRESLSFS